MFGTGVSKVPDLIIAKVVETQVIISNASIEKMAKEGKRRKAGTEDRWREERKKCKKGRRWKKRSFDDSQWMCGLYNGGRAGRAGQGGGEQGSRDSGVGELVSCDCVGR